MGANTDRGKLLKSEAGGDDNIIKLGGAQSTSELSIGDKKLMKAVRDEEEAKKALEKLRASIDLQENNKIVEPKKKPKSTRSSQ